MYPEHLIKFILRTFGMHYLMLYLKPWRSIIFKELVLGGLVVFKLFEVININLRENHGLKTMGENLFKC